MKRLVAFGRHSMLRPIGLQIPRAELPLQSHPPVDLIRGNSSQEHGYVGHVDHPARHLRRLPAVAEGPWMRARRVGGQGGTERQ